MQLITQLYLNDYNFVNDLSTLLQLRVDFAQVTLEVSEAQKFDKNACAIDMQTLAVEVFTLLLEDSVDFTMYKVLNAADIREPVDLLDINQKTITSILSALQNPAIHHIVLSYLNVITYNNYKAQIVSGVAILQDNNEDSTSYSIHAQYYQETAGQDRLNSNGNSGDHTVIDDWSTY